MAINSSRTILTASEEGEGKRGFVEPKSIRFPLELVDDQLGECSEALLSEFFESALSEARFWQV